MAKSAMETSINEEKSMKALYISGSEM